MTFGFALLTAGTVLVYSGWTNSSIPDVLKGLAVRKGGAGDTGFVSLLTAPATGAKEAGTPNSGGGNSGKRVPKNAPAALAAGVAKASAITAEHHPYVWGGGHAKCGRPDGGDGSDPGIGYDCSGAVCAVLCAMGLLEGTMVSGELAAWGEPGPGKWVTIYANDTHTFMKINGVWFGTGSGKRAFRGGAAWGNHDSTAGYAVRHPKGY